MYTNRRTAAWQRDILAAMASFAYIPRSSTLLLLFKAARERLTAAGDNLGSLSDARLASATEEMNRISDDIRQAKGAGYSGSGQARDDAANQRLPGPALPSASQQPYELAVAAYDVSAEPDGVQWGGEYNALASRGEKAAFVALLVRLGYSPHHFRVTVRRVPPQGLGDARQRYTVQVAQLRDGMPDRDKRYAGGHGEDWVNEFCRDAAMDFPNNILPIRSSDIRHFPG